MRVAKKTKNKGVKLAEYRCCRCSDPIVAGEEYFEWKFRHAQPTRQHAKHGSPRQSQLCNGKMSGVYAAIEGAEDDVAACRAANDPSGLADALNTCADAVEQVKDEYEESKSNMPDHLQDVGTGADMQEKIDALEQFVSALQDAANECEDWDMSEESPEPGESHTDTCAVNNEPAEGESECDSTCDCGYDELEAQKETWEAERDEKFNEAFDRAENVLSELSI